MYRVLFTEAVIFRPRLIRWFSLLLKSYRTAGKPMRTVLPFSTEIQILSRQGLLPRITGTRGYVIQNPPSRPLTTQEMDDVYDLPYTGTWHPMYDAAGGIPALEEVRFSLTSNRGCFGGMQFLRPYFSPGSYPADKKPWIHCPGSGKNDAGSSFQGIYP